MPLDYYSFRVQNSPFYQESSEYIISFPNIDFSDLVFSFYKESRIRYIPAVTLESLLSPTHNILSSVHMEQFTQDEAPGTGKCSLIVWSVDRESSIVKELCWSEEAGFWVFT